MKLANSILLSLATLGLCNASLQAEVPLLVKGQTDYKIYLDENHTEVEQTAINELQDFLLKSTKQYYPITDIKQDKLIVIGSGEYAQSLLPNVDFKNFKDDEILIKTVDEKLILSGDNPIYSVHTFLENELGIQFWSATETEIPDHHNIKLDDIGIRYAPIFNQREHLIYEALYNPKFTARLKLNGHHQRLPENWGGHYEILGFVHTFGNFIPREKYAKDHPEWFVLQDSTDNGTRNYNGLCLSNDEMRKEMTKNILAYLREQHKPRIISVSQNDNRIVCQCEKCKALNKKEESQAATLIKFVNDVAVEVEKEFPDVKVETLAYMYTRKAPKTVKPRKNVIVRLCAFECNFSKPLDSKHNARFAQDVREWSEISPELAIWNYTTNYSYYLLPMPNWSNLDDDLRFYAAHKVRSMFEQGNYNGHAKIGDMMQMRNWVISKMLWNPELKVEDLIHEFAEGYYGPAGKYIEDYIWLLEEDVQKANINLRIYYHNTKNWLQAETIVKAWDLMTKAREAVKGNPKYEERVELATVPMRVVLSERYCQRKDDKTFDTIKDCYDDPDQFIKDLIQMLDAYAPLRYREGRWFDGKRKEWLKHVANK